MLKRILWHRIQYKRYAIELPRKLGGGGGFKRMKNKEVLQNCFLNKCAVKFNYILLYFHFHFHSYNSIASPTVIAMHIMWTAAG